MAIGREGRCWSSHKNAKHGLKQRTSMWGVFVIKNQVSGVFLWIVILEWILFYLAAKKAFRGTRQ